MLKCGGIGVGVAHSSWLKWKLWVNSETKVLKIVGEILLRSQQTICLLEMID